MFVIIHQLISDNSLTTNLVNKEPSCEEESNAEENQSEVGEHCRVDRWHVPGHGADVRDGHDDG